MDKSVGVGAGAVAEGGRKWRLARGMWVWSVGMVCGYGLWVATGSVFDWFFR